MLILVNVEDDNLSILDTDDNIIEIITSDDYINRYNSLHIAGLFIKETGELWKVPLDITKFNFHSKVSKDYFGKVLKMNCGLYCMITGYRSNTDVDFMFETGTSLLNCSRLRKFNDYTLAPLIKDIRIGEENIMNNGAKAKILSYRNHRDIDIIFEDSTIRTTTYENFLNGCVLNQNCNRHINESKLMNNGMLATIIRWTNFDNIDVRFANNYIAYNKTYQSFCNGEIANPTINKAHSLPEAILYYNLIKNNIDVALNTKLSFLKYKSGNTGEVDLYFEHNGFKYVIEYDGVFHSYKRDYLMDLEKDALLRENDIKVIRIREYECSFALMRTLSYVKDWFFTDYKLIEFNKRVSISKGLGISLVRNSLKEIFQLLGLDSFTIYLNDSVINLCKEEVL